MCTRLSSSNTFELDLLLKELEMRMRPFILCIKKLDIELRLHENLVRITLSICRLYLDSPKPIEVWVESDSIVMDLLLKIPVSEIPPSENIKWEICSLKSS